MKKHYIFKFILLLIPVSAFLLMSSSDGRSEGRTGSPGDGSNTCAACHSGSVTDASFDITTDIPDTGYLLDTEYTININTTSGSSSVGFQLTAENSSASKIGTFTAGTGSQLANSNNSVTHSSPSSSGDWSFKWRSPSTDLGRVTFYGVVNASSGQGAFNGQDQVVLNNTSAPSLSVSEANRLDFEMFPNPASENVTIQLPSGDGKATVQFYDYIGKLALTRTITDFNNKIDINELSSGVYILKVSTDSKIGSQKFIKR